MDIVTYNIQFGLGKDGRLDLSRIAREVAGADIIALQEVERHWQRSCNTDQVAQLAGILGSYYWVYGPYFDVDKSARRSDGSVMNVRRQFGNMILSKTPIISSRLFPLPKSALGQRHNMVAGMLEGVVALPMGGALRLYNAHLGARLRHDRVAQIMTIRDIIHRAPAEGGAWTGDEVGPLWEEDSMPPPMPDDFVLLGDFNLESGDPEYDHLVGPWDEDTGRIAAPQAFIDSWVAAGHDERDGATYHEHPGTSATVGMRIDYAFVAPAMAGAVNKAWIDAAAQGSDHQPYWIDLKLQI